MALARYEYDRPLAARILASHGYHVFPLRPRAKEPHGLLAPRGCYDASNDTATVEQWWRSVPDANIGIAAGHGGLLVIDIDPEHGGYDTARELRQLLPLTLAALTGSGGMHLYYLAPEPKNSVAKIGPGIDTRGAGGYVVAPPSVHPNGSLYAWIVRHARPRRPIQAPPGLLALVNGATTLAAGEPSPGQAGPASPAHHANGREDPDLARIVTPRLGSRNDGPTAYGQAAIDALELELRQAPIGRRNDTLVMAARRIGQLVAAEHLDDPSDAIFRLTNAAAAVGLGQQETRATLRSGYRYGLEHASYRPPPAAIHPDTIPTPHLYAPRLPNPRL